MLKRKFALTPEESQEVLRLETERDDASLKAAAAQKRGEINAAALENQRAARAVSRIKEIYSTA